MKIMIISINDISGGAARAAFRLHESLLQSSIDSQMLVMDKKSDIDSVVTPYGSKNILNKIYHKTLRIFYTAYEQLLLKKYKQLKNSQWGPFLPAIIKNPRLVKGINKMKPDIVHLHWIYAGMLSIEDIAKIKMPIIWSLHDQWAFTGGCCYVANEQVTLNSDFNTMCEKYTTQCGKCPFLNSNKTKDLSHSVLKRKEKIFTKTSSITIIGLSQWLADCAKKSVVFANRNIVCLPNPINTNIFKPIDKFHSRILWNLPQYKKLILFGAIFATSIPHKGYDLLLEALSKVSSENIELVVFGASKPKNSLAFPFKVNYLGNLHDDVSLISLYNACDVMLVPSRRENLSNTIMESLACANPVVAFDIGGNSDMIEHKKNGYLAQAFDTFDFAKGIDWVLNNENYDELCKNARDKVVREFDYAVVAKKYINLYEKILK